MNIPVKEIQRLSQEHYRVNFRWPDIVAEDGLQWIPGAREHLKEMVASVNALRLAIKSYAKSPEYLLDPQHRVYFAWRYLDEPLQHCEWLLYRDIILHFADWMQFDASGEALIQQAMQEAEADREITRIRIRVDEEKRNRARAKYARCQGRIRVVGLDYDYRGFFILHFDKTMWEDAFEAECDGDRTAMEQEKQRFQHLRDAIDNYRSEQCLMGEKRYGYPRHSTHGWDYTWHLREGIILAFVDWLEFDAPLETLMEQAKEREQQRVKAHNRGVRERRSLRKQQEQERKTVDAREEVERQWYAACGPTEALQEMGLTQRATREDIKRQYRTLAKQCHPDIGGDPVQFKRLNHAHQIVLAWAS